MTLADVSMNLMTIFTITFIISIVGCFYTTINRRNNDSGFLQVDLKNIQLPVIIRPTGKWFFAYVYSLYGFFLTGTVSVANMFITSPNREKRTIDLTNLSSIENMPYLIIYVIGLLSVIFLIAALIKLIAASSARVELSFDRMVYSNIFREIEIQFCDIKDYTYINEVYSGILRGTKFDITVPGLVVYVKNTYSHVKKLTLPGFTIEDAELIRDYLNMKYDEMHINSNEVR